MKTRVLYLSLACVAFLPFTSFAGDDAAPAAVPAESTKSLTPAEAVELLSRKGIISQTPKSKELLSHFEAYQQGKESMSDYPYIDAIFELYREASGSGWAKLPAKAVRAFVQAGCSIRDLAFCCACATSSEVPDKALLTEVLLAGATLSPEVRNAADASGYTPLMYAARYGMDEGLVSKYVNDAASVNATNRKGWSALMYASCLPEDAPEAADIVQKLLGAGADVNAVNNDEWDALMLAAQSGNMAVVKALLKSGADVTACNNRGESALQIAAVNKKTEVCRALLDAGADVNAKDYDGWTPLNIVVKQADEAQEAEYLPIINLLKEAGADVTIANFNGWNPLMLSARNGTEKIAKELIQAGTNVNARDINGMTALMFAAGNNRVQVCKLLIAAGADVNLGDNSRLTPLMFATATQQVEVCKLLIEAGADVNAKSDNGITAPEVARTPEMKALYAK